MALPKRPTQPLSEGFNPLSYSLFPPCKSVEVSTQRGSTMGGDNTLIAKRRQQLRPDCRGLKPIDFYRSAVISLLKQQNAGKLFLMFLKKLSLKKSEVFNPETPYPWRRYPFLPKSQVRTPSKP